MTHALHDRRRVAAAGALVLASAAVALTGCGHPVGSAPASYDVAWVTTGASVTLPGTTVTPVDLSGRHRGAPVTVGSLPSALAYTAGDAGLLVVTQGDDTLHEIDPASHDVVHSVGVGLEPDAVAVAPGGTGGKGETGAVSATPDPGGAGGGSVPAFDSRGRFQFGDGGEAPGSLAGAWPRAAVTAPASSSVRGSTSRPV